MAAYPDNLVIRSADTAAELGRLRLGAQARARYGAPYATIHRADLQALLLQAVQGEAGEALVQDRSLPPNPGDRSDWDHAALGADLQQLLHSAAPTLQWLVHTMGCRRLWHLQLRDSVGRASQMRQGRLTILGDAAPTPCCPTWPRGPTWPLKMPWRWAKHSPLLAPRQRLWPNARKSAGNATPEFKTESG